MARKRKTTNPQERKHLDLPSALAEAAELIRTWQSEWGPFEPHGAQGLDPAVFVSAWEAYAGRLKGNYPFFHPRYAGQMLKPPHPVAVLGYVTAMLINPNNHALDGGPPTGQMEKEVVHQLASMFHLPDDTLGHLTTSGTIANLEALWVARALRPGKAVAFSTEAHYTHARMCEVLGIKTVEIPADAGGRMDAGALEERLRHGRIGTVVATAGSTGLGAVDPIHDLVALRERYDFRLHVDAAYGGFFALLAWSDDPHVPAGPLKAIASADSVCVDPHKHGLQPYGCGCVLFRDPAVGTLYKHDSPYTYFTSDELHLGEISLECSRAGAAAGALWLTLQCLPLKDDEGLGSFLLAGLRAARKWADWIKRSDLLALYLEPELDIVTFFPRVTSSRLSDVDAASQALFDAAMQDREHPVFLSLLKVPSARLVGRAGLGHADVERVRILRSVLMKPEHESFAPYLHEHVERHAAGR